MGSWFVGKLIEADIVAHKFEVQKGQKVIGEICANSVVISGHQVGRVTARHVRLAATCILEGDVIHSTIEIEEGAFFEGSIRRKDQPLDDRTEEVQNFLRAPAAIVGNDKTKEQHVTKSISA